MRLGENVRKIYDVSMRLEEGMLFYPDDPRFEKKDVMRLEKGAAAEVISYTLGSHTGTHLDLPSHIIKNGKRLKDIPIELLLGETVVIDLTKGEGVIKQEEIAPHLPPDAKRILLKTSNSTDNCIGSKNFREDYRSLGPDGAKMLVEEGVILVGIDYLSIEAFVNPNLEVHRYLLEHDLIILEGLDLRGVPPGRYGIICLPLNIPDASGAPARVLLVENL